MRVLEDTLTLMNHRLDMEAYLNPRPYLTKASELLKDKKYV